MLLGPSGAGKSHPAVSLGQLAEPKDLKTRFVTAADLMLQLSTAKVQDKLESYLRRSVLTPELSIAIGCGSFESTRYILAIQPLFSLLFMEIPVIL